jgi:hypothetical protein
MASSQFLRAGRANSCSKFFVKRAECLEVVPSLGEAQVFIWTAPDFIGCSVVLSIVVPITDRANLVGAPRGKRSVTATWASHAFTARDIHDVRRRPIADISIHNVEELTHHPYDCQQAHYCQPYVPI